MQNCTRGRFALESRCGRIECLFQTTKTQDKIKVRRKLYLSLPHIGILASPVQIACFICSFGMGPCYRRQYWDGIFSPANFLHLLTCTFFTCSIGMAPSHLQIFSPADLAWHLPGLPHAPKNKNDQAKIQIQTEISETTMKSASTQTKISFSIQKHPNFAEKPRNGLKITRNKFEMHCNPTVPP